jgi:hypothetical protein
LDYRNLALSVHYLKMHLEAFGTGTSKLCRGICLKGRIAGRGKGKRRVDEGGGGGKWV